LYSPADRIRAPPDVSLLPRQLGELALHERAHVELRVGVRLVLGILAARDERRGLTEGRFE
jgi:hypothetical protein